MLFMLFKWLPILPLFGFSSRVVAYDLVREYSGITFFDEWSFYGGYDNLTFGDVFWLNTNDAYAQGLAYINAAGNAILKVDNEHSVALNDKRASVRITTQASYAVGSLWIADMVHIPYGCSVWPAFWTMGPTWPDDGEIDILEGINLMNHNQMALHTLPGCTHSTPPNQMGISGELDCSAPSGCTVADSGLNSYGPEFAAAGGGVFAAQFDISGIFVWFWSRPNVPSSVAQTVSSSSPINISDWGPPSASFPAITCNITDFFQPQNLVFDITLCGNWAGLPADYFPACGDTGPTGICYNDNVVGSGDRFDDAYFEIQYVRAYTTGGVAPTPTAAAVGIATPPTPSTSTTIGTRLVPSTLFYPASSEALRLQALGFKPFLLLVLSAVFLGCFPYL